VGAKGLKELKERLESRKAWLDHLMQLAEKLDKQREEAKLVAVRGLAGPAGDLLGLIRSLRRHVASECQGLSAQLLQLSKAFAASRREIASAATSLLASAASQSLASPSASGTSPPAATASQVLVAVDLGRSMDTDRLQDVALLAQALLWSLLENPYVHPPPVDSRPVSATSRPPHTVNGSSGANGSGGIGVYQPSGGTMRRGDGADERKTSTTSALVGSRGDVSGRRRGFNLVAIRDGILPLVWRNEVPTVAVELEAVQAACDWIHAQVAAMSSVTAGSSSFPSPGRSGPGGNGSGVGESIPCKNEFNLWCNLALDASVRRLRSGRQRTLSCLGGKSVPTNAIQSEASSAGPTTTGAVNCGVKSPRPIATLGSGSPVGSMRASLTAEEGTGAGKEDGGVVFLTGADIVSSRGPKASLDSYNSLDLAVVVDATAPPRSGREAGRRAMAEAVVHLLQSLLRDRSKYSSVRIGCVVVTPSCDLGSPRPMNPDECDPVGFRDFKELDDGSSDDGDEAAKTEAHDAPAKDDASSTRSGSKGLWMETLTSDPAKIQEMARRIQRAFEVVPVPNTQHSQGPLPEQVLRPPSAEPLSADRIPLGEASVASNFRKRPATAGAMRVGGQGVASCGTGELFTEAEMATAWIGFEALNGAPSNAGGFCRSAVKGLRAATKLGWGSAIRFLLVIGPEVEPSTGMPLCTKCERRDIFPAPPPQFQDSPSFSPTLSSQSSPYGSPLSRRIPPNGAPASPPRFLHSGSGRLGGSASSLVASSHNSTTAVDGSGSPMAPIPSSPPAQRAVGSGTVGARAGPSTYGGHRNSLSQINGFQAAEALCALGDCFVSCWFLSHPAVKDHRRRRAKLVRRYECRCTGRNSAAGQGLWGYTEVAGRWEACGAATEGATLSTQSDSACPAGPDSGGEDDAKFLTDRLIQLVHLESVAQGAHLSTISDAAPQDFLETLLGVRGGSSPPSGQTAYPARIDCLISGNIGTVAKNALISIASVGRGSFRQIGTLDHSSNPAEGRCNFHFRHTCLLATCRSGVNAFRTRAGSGGQTQSGGGGSIWSMYGGISGPGWARAEPSGVNKPRFDANFAKSLDDVAAISNRLISLGLEPDPARLDDPKLALEGAERLSARYEAALDQALASRRPEGSGKGGRMLPKACPDRIHETLDKIEALASELIGSGWDPTQLRDLSDDGLREMVAGRAQRYFATIDRVVVGTTTAAAARRLNASGGDLSARGPPSARGASSSAAALPLLGGGTCESAMDISFASCLVDVEEAARGLREAGLDPSTACCASSPRQHPRDGAAGPEPPAVSSPSGGSGAGGWWSGDTSGSAHLAEGLRRARAAVQEELDRVRGFLDSFGSMI